MKIDDIIPEFKSNLNDLQGKSGMTMRLFYHAKLENFEGQYFNIHVYEDYMRRKNPQAYIVKLEKISAEQFIHEKYMSSLNQQEDPSFQMQQDNKKGFGTN